MEISSYKKLVVEGWNVFNGFDTLLAGAFILFHDTHSDSPRSQVN